ncbi:hypothetical protein DFH29DRAFT_876941 [Suillus ampliporus]|nr:hypothetical protein DFH29DRAFT_876941 [Suillus ampliporus]
MPPRKKSEPSNTETTHSGFSLDTRPIQAKMPENDPAAEAQRLNQEVETARIGNGYINILDLENPLIFGTYNDRPEKMSEINKMMTSFECHGIQSMDEKNALVIIIERSRLSGNQSLDVPWTDINALPHVRFLDTAGLTLASGQHRVAALRKLMQTHTDELVVQLKCLERLQNIDNPSPAQQEEHRDLREHIAELKGATQIKGKWGVKLYDAGCNVTSKRQRLIRTTGDFNHQGLSVTVPLLPYRDDSHGSKRHRPPIALSGRFSCKRPPVPLPTRPFLAFRPGPDLLWVEMAALSVV